MDYTMTIAVCQGIRGGGGGIAATNGAGTAGGAVWDSRLFNHLFQSALLTQAAM